ncbi:MAG: hypothetical protein V3V81_08155 [Candidatus Bathyarchaeia archaeon]
MSVHLEEFFISVDSTVATGAILDEVKQILLDGCASEDYDYAEVDVADGTNADFAFSAIKQE